MKKQVRILISGRVQGVFFRANAKRVADSYGLVGFTKNLRDGRVEIVGQGKENALRALLDWCYRGSLLAHVDSLSIEWQEVDSINQYRKFTIERDETNIIADKIHALTNLGRRVLNRVDKAVEKNEINLPKHIVIIPDGNRRWAKERGLASWQGHKKGLDRTKEILKTANEMGIKYITMWGFSTENWDRPKEEVSWLMEAFTKAIKDLGKDLIENQTSFRHLGRKDRLDKELAKNISELEEKTKHFIGKTFSIALDYGGRDEIVRAANKALENGEVNEKNMTESMDTAGIPDPDLIIRTSGEQRLSGMFPWQSTYAELYFTPLHFPDFSSDQFKLALADYSSRERRFGK